MVLEWLRRRDPALDTMLRRYLFIDKPVLEREADADADTDAGESGSVERGGDGSLGIGDLREEVQRSNDLLRELAPVSDEAWKQIEDERVPG